MVPLEGAKTGFDCEAHLSPKRLITRVPFGWGCASVGKLPSFD